MSLRARSVVYAYGTRRVLDGVSIELSPGEVVGLVGANGAGKSTLLRTLAGLVPPESGVVEWDGRDLRIVSRRELARTIGFVPQQVRVSFPVPVAHFVGLGRFAHESILGASDVGHVAAVERALARMGAADLARRRTDQLSGGEFRRVVVAQALAQDPRVLLFDEPVQQLDLEHQLEVMEFARAFAREPGRAVAVVLHDLGLAARYCDRLVVLQSGRVVAEGAPAGVLTPEVVGRVFGVRAEITRCAATGAVLVVPVERARAETSRPDARVEDLGNMP